MKKLLPIMAIAIMIFTGACKKGDTTPTASSDNSWKLGSTTYKTVFSYRSTTSGGTPTTLLSFYDAIPSSALNFNSVSLSFNVVPTASGTYQMVGVGGATAAGKFEIAAGGPGAAYAYIGTPVDVTITVTGGKAKIVIPEVTMKSTVSGQADVKLSGTVQEL